MTSATPGARASTGRRSKSMVLPWATLFLLLAAFMLTRSSLVPSHFYSVMAWAALHGHLDVPPAHDVAIYNGRAYYPFGPAPALLVLPLVALMGPNMPSTPLSVPALLVALPAFHRLTRRAADGTGLRLWWLLAVVAGTPLLACAFADNAYFAAHVVVVACLTWALVLALDGEAPLAAGALVGIAAATRLDAAGAALPLAAMYARGDRSGRWAARPVLRLALGVAPFLVLVALYNQARFGSPLESGYALQALNFAPLEALRAQGLFSIRHLPVNLYYFLAAGPVFAGGATSLPSRFPWLTPSDWGMGLIWTSPWMLLALWARWRQAALVAASAALVLLPVLTYYGIGLIQFGYRYGLDALPFIFLLSMWGAGRVRAGRTLLLTLFSWSLVVNLWGDVWLMGGWGGPRFA